ncbi:helix-turn-helix domain containing protein [Candidatus Poribacteria bacterium]|nr:helix-turn-helix domain containing protein [Candidatus Poribacteria bacterium]
MIFACIETESETAKLLEAIQQAEKPDIYRRLMTIQLSAEGTSANQLADIFKLTPQTIRGFIHTDNQGGIEPLIPPKKPGRRPRLNLTKEQWLDILHQSPASFETLSTQSQNWTLELLSDYCSQYHAVRLRPSRLWYI